MEFVTKTITYNLFRPTEEGSEYYYVRIVSPRGKHEWSLGYKNKLGEVHLIGGSLAEEIFAKLDSEFELEVDKMFKTLTEDDKKQMKLAKFLGAKDGNGTDKHPYVLINVPNFYGSTDTCTVQTLKFNSDWRWLMLVVTEIESQGFVVEISETYCKISFQRKTIIDIGGGDYDKFSATFEACFKFSENKFDI